MNGTQLFTLIVLVVVFSFILKVVRASTNRQGAGKVCAECGTEHPRIGRFCRQCGKSLR